MRFYEIKNQVRSGILLTGGIYLPFSPMISKQHFLIGFIFIKSKKDVSNEYILLFQRKINRKPRKLLNFNSPKNRLFLLINKVAFVS
jgi:hypothetical protein